VGAGQDLEEVAARVLEVEAATSVVLTDLTGPRPRRVGPVAEAPLADSGEGLVKLGVGDGERVVLRRDAVVAVGEVEGDTVGHLHRNERTHTDRRWEPEDLGHELGRRLLVTSDHDGVIEPHAHRTTTAAGSASVNVISMLRA